MIHRLAFSLLFLASTEAFCVTPHRHSSTVLRAESNDILNSPAFLQRKFEVLQTDLQKAEDALAAAQQRLEEGKAEWGPQLADLQTEYQNIQKRMNEQSKGGDSMATVQVARNMLNVLDNFDRAFGAVQPSNDEELAIEAEYKGTYQMMLDAFAEMGVEEIPTVGVEFDYQVHQAVMQKPSDEYEEGIVCEEFQKGFKCGDSLVRAAMVAVAV
ncbi:molecular chaperone GrpE [Fistulifera solaris]|uniref:GrpE protein homolog n=1 Tax=Fistulifera solaris TaxID=1519565 RepID=A0A1Z5KT30_FISSO|nr:molecular chaperone GrpE [Fistulifera solaris]|eukprot:GAX29484.1 molecular chaperone GrpE [Fistulifera solaris]